MHPSILLHGLPDHDDAVRAAVRETVVTAGVAHTAERVAAAAAAVDDASQRVAASGFGDLAAALRQRSQTVLVGLLAGTDPASGGSTAAALPSPPTPPASLDVGRKGRKPSGGA